MNICLTTPAPGGRGCGCRKKGGVYGSLGTSPDGKLVWSFLIDPPGLYEGEKFRGMIDGTHLFQVNHDDTLVLLDMVGMEHYPTVACFVEEVRRYGLSRNLSGLDFSVMNGKKVYLATIHWRAIPQLENPQVPEVVFQYCNHSDYSEHLPECIYWLWALAYQYHKCDQVGRIEMPWGKFLPLHVFGAAKKVYEWNTCEELITQYMPHVDGYEPGVFAIWPLTHLECIDYVPDIAGLSDCGLPIMVMEE